jgi:hypothetical protein
MANATWSYLQNPFDNVTKSSYKNMYLMATDHFDKLLANKTDATINELYEFGKPFFDAFITQYRKSGTDDNVYKMYTKQFEDLLLELSGTLARRWDVQIQTQFDIDTSAYMGLMPNGRRPFQSGPYDLRINAVKALSDMLLLYPVLSDLQKEVNDFHTAILEARTKQQGIENLGQTNTSDIENSRLALAQAMHHIFGGLIQKFYLDLAKVESFYELRYLRRSPSSGNNDAPLALEEVTIAQGSSATALVNKIMGGSKLTVTNMGEATLTAYSAVDGNSPVPANGGYTISAGQSVSFDAVAGDTLVKIINDIDPFDGKALVEKIA